jgi:hypothetical protein
MFSVAADLQQAVAEIIVDAGRGPKSTLFQEIAPPAVRTVDGDRANKAGLDLAIGRNATIGISYVGQIANNVQDHAAKGKFSWKF